MTSLFAQFKTDPELERKGILIEYGFNDRTGAPIAFRIARAGGGNAQFQKRLEADMKPYRRQIQTDTLDNKVAERILRKVFAETVVLGWENVDDENGAELPFTVENCVALFEKLPDLFKDLQEQAQKSALYRATIRETDAGN